MPALSLSQRLIRFWIYFSGLLVLMLGLRLLYLLWNASLFQGQDSARILSSFFWGLRFDLSALAYLSLPLFLFCLLPWGRWRQGEMWWARLSFFWSLLWQGLFLIFNLIDVEMVNFVGRRMTSDVIFLLGEAQGKATGFLTSFAGLFAWAFFFLGLFFAWTWWVFWRPWRQDRLGLSSRRGFAAPLGLALATFLLLILAGRGGLQSKPLSFVDAHHFALPSLNNLTLNTSFAILKDWGRPRLPRSKYFDDPVEMNRWLEGAVTGTSWLEGRRPLKPQNVVILILESFGTDYWGPQANGVSYTPFLDELSRKGLFFSHSYANARRSIEGVAAVLGGIPALMNEPFVSSSFSSNEFIGLGRFLSQFGYHSAFFHGGNNGTMHFDGFTRSAGLRDYFGAREYPFPEHHDGSWGIYDRPFLQWMKSKMDEMPRPFLVSYFSISSHHPYRIPQAEEAKFPEGPLPILKTIAYADDSLREFFAAASRSDWYRDTLFVITADHTGPPLNPAFASELGRFRAPILFYHPNFNWPQEIATHQPVQQIDLLPSIADFLGRQAEAPRLPLSRSVFQEGPRWVTLFLDGTYWIVGEKSFLTWRPPQGVSELYDLQDLDQKNPLRAGREDERQELETRLKASIQSFSEGMWENRLYLPESTSK